MIELVVFYMFYSISQYQSSKKKKWIFWSILTGVLVVFSLTRQVILLGFAFSILMILQKSKLWKKILVICVLFGVYQFVLPQIPIYKTMTELSENQMEKNKYKEEERKHLYKGIYYRSKSEAVIAMLLESYGIEFKYEVRIEVGGRAVYPDFVIRRKRDGKIILWEHFGMIHDEEYQQGMFRKLIAYHEAGYNIWDNLIVSFDSENGSIDIDSIEKMITLYLL